MFDNIAKIFNDMFGFDNMDTFVEDPVNNDKKYFVLNTITNKHQCYTKEEVINEIEKYGADNLFIFKKKDEIKVKVSLEENTNDKMDIM